MYEGILLSKKNGSTQLRVNDKFALILNKEFEQLNLFLKNSCRKEMTFTDYTELLASMNTIRLPAFIQVQPIKKGKNSKKITLDLTSLLK